LRETKIRNGEVDVGTKDDERRGEDLEMKRMI
jgi:hypothetical protein